MLTWPIDHTHGHHWHIGLLYHFRIMNWTGGSSSTLSSLSASFNFVYCLQFISPSAALVYLVISQAFMPPKCKQASESRRPCARPVITGHIGPSAREILFQPWQFEPALCLGRFNPDRRRRACQQPDHLLLMVFHHG